MASPCPDGDLDALEGTVAGAPGADLQGASAGERRQVEGGFEVSPGVAPVVAQNGPAREDLPAGSVRVMVLAASGLRE